MYILLLCISNIASAASHSLYENSLTSWSIDNWDHRVSKDMEVMELHNASINLLASLRPSNDPIWTSFGQGPNGPIYTVATDSRNNIYIGGDFDKIGDDPFYNAAAWDGHNWVRVGDPKGLEIPGFDDKVRKIIVDQNDIIYFGGDFKKLKDENGDETEISSPNLYSSNGSDLSGGVLDKGYLRGMTFDNNGDLVIAGIEFYWDPFHHNKYYYRKYSNGSWNDVQYLKDIHTKEADDPISLCFDQHNNLFVSIPRVGIYKFVQAQKITVKSVLNSNSWVTNIVFNKKDQTIYYGYSYFYDPGADPHLAADRSLEGWFHKNVVDRNAGSIVYKYDGHSSKAICNMFETFTNWIEIDEVNADLYIGGYNPKFYIPLIVNSYTPVLLKFKLETSKNRWSYLNGKPETNLRIAGKGTRDNELFRGMQFDNDGNLLVVGSFSHIMLEFPSNKIAELYTDDLSDVYFASHVHIGETKERTVPGTVLTAEGAVAIIEEGHVSSTKIRSDLLKNNSLFVDLGVVSEDLIIVDPGEWADHVLDKGYPLWSMTKVKAFIEQYGHLPGVPSEQQIVKEGYAAHEMNTIFMTKIEELVLHCIQLNEAIDQSFDHKKLLLDKIKALRSEFNTHTDKQRNQKR